MSDLASRLCALAALAACNHDPLFGTPDAGRDEDGGREQDGGREEDGGREDGGTHDVIAPVVLATVPSDGQIEVSPSTGLRVVFSEPVNGGTIQAFIETEEITITDTRLDGAELTARPVERLPPNTGARVVIAGFEDAAGNVMEPFAFTFSTSDPLVPEVIASTPAEGSTVPQGTAALAVDFSETMNAARGVALLQGGPGTIDAPVWSGSSARFALSGLAADTDYRVVLSGFEDPAGNALDETAYLGDGAIDFRTGPDVTAPVVNESSPAEGAISVAPARTTVQIEFSEVMDTGAGVATFASTTLTETWHGGGTILRLDVSGVLEANQTYRIALDGFTDATGNPLDGAVYLDDGALDFSTGEDALAPFVSSSSPTERSTGISYTTSTVRVTFSEPMDTSLTSVPYDDGDTSGVWTGTWSSGGATLTIDVDLISGRTYELDLRAFQDADGVSLDDAHGYLDDGRLSFTTSAPAGENCGDFLTEAQATTNADGNLQWNVLSAQVANVDGSAPCDVSGGSADAVIRYRKRTPDSTAASGGTVLRITVGSNGFRPEVNVDVLRACDPSAASARLACATNAHPQTIELDVGAGDYFVWVAASDGSLSGTITVEIEEVPAGPGDTCANAIPIAAGTTMIAPSGTQRIQAPSCMGPEITWYRYTAAQGLGIVSVSPSRSIAARDAASGTNQQCRASGELLPVFVEPGRTACIAVGSGAATALTIEERPYDGVRGIGTDTGIQLGSLTSAPTSTFVAATPTRIYTAAGSELLVAPRAGGVLSSFDPGPSIPGAQGVAIGEAIYGISSATFNPTAPSSLVFRMVDEAGMPAPQPIDTMPAYTSATKLGAMIVDGSSFLIAQDTPAAGGPTYFYSLPVSGGAPIPIGSNDALEDVSALAADATFIYAMANLGDATSEGIYRLRRDELANPAAVPVLVYGGGLDYSDENGAMYLASFGGTTWMYFRTFGPAHVHLLLDPGGAAPRCLGPIWTTASDDRTGMAYDPSVPALFVLDHAPSPDQWVRLE